MRSRVHTSRWLGGSTLLVVAVVAGCAQASQSGSVSSKPWLGEEGPIYRFASSGARKVHESRTSSFALDRIDQRMLPLDGTYRRAGTGRGVTVYVFDGGVSPTHPELVGRVHDLGLDCHAHG